MRTARNDHASFRMNSVALVFVCDGKTIKTTNQATSASDTDRDEEMRQAFGLIEIRGHVMLPLCFRKKVMCVHCCKLIERFANTVLLACFVCQPFQINTSSEACLFSRDGIQCMPCSASFHADCAPMVRFPCSQAANPNTMAVCRFACSTSLHSPPRFMR